MEVATCRCARTWADIGALVCASRALSATPDCAILKSSVLPFALPSARFDVAMTQAQESRPDVELPERQPADDGDEAQALTSTVRAAERTLRSVLERRQLFEAGALDDVERTVAEVDRRLTRRELRVVVLGERNSGKSTLLDAIVGDRLLGGARRQAAVVTFLRQSNAPRYRARFSSGAVDDFASREPPVLSELALAAERLEQELTEADESYRVKRSELRRAIEHHERADLDVEQARCEANGARELVDNAGIELYSLEQRAARLEATVVERARQLPRSLLEPPPAWAVWLWLWHALFVTFRRGHWQSYRALLLEREAVGARLDASREQARDAEQARLLAESDLAPLDSGAEQARTRADDVERALRAAQAERERLRAELSALRSQREHHESERFRQFLAELQTLSARPDLRELAIDYPAKSLPADVAIVDVPGLVSPSDPEWQLIREEADGCILVSELDRAVSEATKQFLRQLRQVVPHVLLALTKMDQAFQRAERRGAAQPWAEVELARRIGTRRFARELGRDPQGVLSIAVAAEAALSARGSELAQRFDSEIEKMFLLLRQERALILGARAAAALRSSARSFSAAEERAERAYRARISALEQQRTPEPEVFKQQLLRELQPGLPEAARDALAPLISSVEDGCSLLERLCQQSIAACSSPATLLQVAEQLAAELAERTREQRDSVRMELEGAVERHVARLEQGLFQAVRARYQLLHEVRRSIGSSAGLEPVMSEQTPSFEQVAAQVRERVASFRRARLALLASGSVTGAAGGAFTHVWFALPLGALLGAGLAFVRRWRPMQAEVLALLTAAVARHREATLTELRGAEQALIATIGGTVERSLERALIHFGRWIAEPLAAERQAIESEREKLVELEQLRDQVVARDLELERSLRAAADASAGLCR